MFDRTLGGKDRAGRHVIPPDGRQHIGKSGDAGIMSEKGDCIVLIIQTSDNLFENGRKCMIEFGDEFNVF